MSIFDKVKEMFGDATEKAKNIPEQASSATDDAKSSTSSTLDGLREKAEDAANTGIDKAAAAASEATGGKYDEQINQGADAARKAADKIDGREG